MSVPKQKNPAFVYSVVLHKQLTGTYSVIVYTQNKRTKDVRKRTVKKNLTKQSAEELQFSLELIYKPEHP